VASARVKKPDWLLNADAEALGAAIAALPEAEKMVITLLY